MKRRRRRPFSRALWAMALVAAAIHFAVPVAVRLARRPDVRLAGACAVLLILAYAFTRVRRFLRRRRRLKLARVSERRRDYVIDETDYRRATPKEQAYRRVMQLTLLECFENACAKCGARDDGVDLDHFFWPKSAGGCFIMRHRDGFLVNNAIPLCTHCNRAKSDRSYRDFFGADQLVMVLEKNARRTRLLNAQSPLDSSGRVYARAKRHSHSSSHRKTGGW